MTTSGTTAFDLDIDDLVEEAYERLGMRMTSGNQLKNGASVVKHLVLGLGKPWVEFVDD